jgi:Reverse transcriptase (RNA-dependent DNA polymerase)
MRKNVLSFSPSRARKFFLSQEIYFNADLPPYYEFKPALDKLLAELDWHSLGEEELKIAKNADNVNHIIFGNKDGSYAWRKLELINPLLYISLVNTLCTKDSWKIIKDRFKKLYSHSSIQCASIPVLGDTNRRQKASQINEWIDTVERESIRLALDYEYLYQTDIVGCYSSIYTHSIAWALHDKSVSKAKRKFNDLLGNKIDHHIQAMNNGQTNGIPQGSVLMDFIAELVLAYADNELYESLKKHQIKDEDYFILRYRDDYRIFVRDPKDGDCIMKELSSVLALLGMSLNTSKTNKGNKVIIDSVKKDKLPMIKLPIAKKLSRNQLRNELLIVYELGTIFPNCGSVSTRLIKINDLVDIKILQKYPFELVSILINIAFENPRSFPVVAALISKAVDKLTQTEKEIILSKITRKIKLLPNSGLLEIWVQRIFIKHNIKPYYEEELCRITNGEDLKIFNTDWIKIKNLKQIIDDTVYVNEDTIKNLDTIIARKEIEIFALKQY